ncbi:MAG: 50S ribosomal protein L6 [Candidatus Andersenbacteria bacterium RIFCSPHIGHO2_12_FULL_45_11b]|uniref:Large ribosomal subunit protein uL6 n=1 Tax=Candidatus Andersenbacteria bacterium RIFCSPHIGHO2_12_FULL_45_11b TaxID=1797282 RepID=A0A1G1X813_9BACT|nr:MAG: 50S ribosomal protein L6 [Candidatus Andersenbacteria bacterium RIFCSPHIGHO2_12_FULL_45_11b]
MSRIGKKEILIPSGITVTVSGADVHIAGPKGELTIAVHPVIGVAVQENMLTCTIARKTKKSSALWGTMRAILANAVEGVHTGFKKQLELQGVGYRAAMQGKNIQLLVGFSHPVLIEAPEGITFSVEKEIITVEGFDAYLVGQVAANIRKVRPPEPYKGKGIRYVGEHVRRKVGKIVGSAA